ncbi:MAG: sigma-70 factor domain-containing protein, partial [Nitrospiraceae bacterium]
MTDHSKDSLQDSLNPAEQVRPHHRAEGEKPKRAPVALELGNGEAAGSSTAVVPVTPLQQYLAEVRRYPFLSKEEELRLFHEFQVRGSREAAVKLILANLRVSVAIASEYRHTGADQMDLIQEGNVGL